MANQKHQRQMNDGEENERFWHNPLQMSKKHTSVGDDDDDVVVLGAVDTAIPTS